MVNIVTAYFESQLFAFRQLPLSSTDIPHMIISVDKFIESCINDVECNDVIISLVYS